MRRQDDQPDRPTAGFLPVKLFNQKKRNRVPLTSAPSQNDFFSHGEFMASTSSATSYNTSGTYGGYQASDPFSGASQSHLWTSQGIPPSQQYSSNTPAPGPVPSMKNYSPKPHPYKVGGTDSKMGQPNNPMKQSQSNPSVNSRQSEYQAPRINESAQSRPTPHAAFSQRGQQAIAHYRPPNTTHQYSQQSRPLSAPVPPPNRPSAHVVQSQNNSWKFTDSFGQQKLPSVGNRSTNQPQTARQTQTEQKTFPMKPAIENSLRILTAVIDGMKHWSQFKDKVPYLFEIFDSAVTLGHHGAKNFLMRDGKEVVQCVFYENEQELPRLIRGQVHRCVGNYDRSRNILMCVSVRPGLPSELRNAQEAVKACDAEMRALVKSLSEV
uniref:spermatogenesis-associated protein 22 isoform X3 n=1 Tax=Scatophagus argus TaxID=75038 RepID=UPI001ED7D38F|nr:spermatogenesis-associated protein 22 isoform X3 [Scatophagus argus]